jgi:hypothetical protein
VYGSIGREFQPLKGLGSKHMNSAQARRALPNNIVSQRNCFSAYFNQNKVTKLSEAKKEEAYI